MALHLGVENVIILDSHGLET